MIHQGTFPFRGDSAVPEDAPRVGDGVLFLDAEAMVRYASPNAVSSLHRMGVHANAQGERLSAIGLDDEALRTAFSARRPGDRGAGVGRHVDAGAGHPPARGGGRPPAPSC